MRNKVYLAGGMRTDWQDILLTLKGFEFFDPRDKEFSGTPTLEEYGTWDLHQIKCSDIVFVYMERTNPSGIGLAVEAGYAKALGKTVILVLEEGNEHIKDRYLEFLKKAADITYNNLADGVEFLNSFKLSNVTNDLPISDLLDSFKDLLSD